MTPRRLLTAGLLLATIAAAVGFTAARREQDRRDAAVEASRLRGWARAEAVAGVSVLPKRVPAADPGELEGLESLPGFHDFAMRCSSCHQLPDPGAYPARAWIGKVAEMQEHVARSGLMPPTDGQLDSVRLFLAAAATRLHPGDRAAAPADSTVR